jgi:hypothetical protein
VQPGTARRRKGGGRGGGGGGEVMVEVEVWRSGDGGEVKGVQGVAA